MYLYVSPSQWMEKKSFQWTDMNANAMKGLRQSFRQCIV